MHSQRFRLVAVVSVALAAIACSDREKLKQDYLQKGDVFVQQEKYAEAIVEYRNAIKQDNRFGEARLKLADALEKVGNTQGAFGEYVRAADLLPADGRAQIKATSYLLTAGRFEDARSRIERLLEREPQNVEAMILLGTSLSGLKKFDEAVKEIEQAITLEPNRGPSYSTLGTVRLAQGNQAEAEKVFRRAVEMDPRSTSSWAALANFQLATGAVRDAEASLKQILELDRNNELANRALAAIYIANNRPKDAEPHLKAVANAPDATEAKFALAEFYVRTDRKADARALLKRMLAEGKAVTGVETRLAQLEYLDKQTKNAHAMVDRILQREPKNAGVLLVKAQWLSSEGQPVAALEAAKAAVLADPGSARSHYVLGVLQGAVRDSEGAIKSFNEALRLNPRATAAQLQLSRLLLLRRDWDTSTQHAEAVLKSAPGNMTARLSLARAGIGRRDVGNARREITALLKDYPKVSEVHSVHGAFLVLADDRPAARRAYEQALALDPRSFEAVNGLVRLDLLNGQIARARATADRMLATAPNRAEMLALTARAHAADKDLAGAEKLLREAISLDATDSESYVMLAQVLLSQSRLDEARIEFDAIVTRNPKDLAAATMAAMIVESQKKLPEAKKRYYAILEVNPRASVAANNLAWLLAEEGAKLDDALKLAQTAVAASPERAEIHDTLGWVYYRKELPSLAIPPFEQSIAKDGGNPTYHYHLALALVKSGGDSARARKALQTALQLKPDYTDAQKLLDSLKG